MRALILNSGIGKRMGALTEHQPKCMIPISEDHTIINWQLAVLRHLGVTDIVMTTGPFEEVLKAHVAAYHESIRFVNNPRYAETNYIYSMELAREEILGDDLLILHGDLIFEPSVLEDLMKVPYSAVALEDGVPLPEKDFKARLRDGCVREIGISIFGEDCLACQPAYKLLRGDMKIWMDAIDEFCAKGEMKVYAENALNTRFEEIEMRPVMMNGRLCSEIDNPEDLTVVSEKFAAYRKGSRNK